MKHLLLTALVLGSLTVSEANAQTTDPMRAACANDTFAYHNDNMCIALAKVPFTPSPSPDTYIVLPSDSRPVPFYGTYERCLEVATEIITRTNGALPKFLGPDPKDFCFKAK